jgi:hypothetical protein
MMTLSNLSEEQVTALGGYLYNLRVTGPRVVNPNKKDFGPSCKELPFSYIVMNAAIGARKEDIIGAVSKLKIAYDQVRQKIA